MPLPLLFGIQCQVQVAQCKDSCKSLKGPLFSTVMILPPSANANANANATASAHNSWQLNPNP